MVFTDAFCHERIENILTGPGILLTMNNVFGYMTLSSTLPPFPLSVFFSSSFFLFIHASPLRKI